jgi:hypothetical protein
MVESPIPPVCSVLIAALPGLWVVGRSLAQRVAQGSAARILLTPGLGLAAWLLAIHGIALATHSFSCGLWAGTLSLALLGGVLWYRGRGVDKGDPAPMHRDGERPNWTAMLVTAFFATLLVAPLALLWSFHDEVWVTGHLSITAQIENGVYPPRHLSFPEFPLRYHYGFNLLCAVVAALFRLPLHLAIDVVTLLCFGWTFCLLWLVGYRILGAGYSALTPILVLFGTGLAMPGSGAFRSAPLSHALLLIGSIEGAEIHPPTLSYFFQHPWSLGLPLAVTTILLLMERAQKPTPWRYMAFCLLLTILSRAQIVVFVAFAASLLLAEPIDEGRLSWARLRGITAAVGVAIALALVLGGFWVPPASEAGSALRLRTEFPSLRGSMQWYLHSFGLVLPLGLLGFLRLRRERLFFGLLTLGGLLVSTFLVYRSSWDVDKFAVLGSFGLAVAAGVPIASALGTGKASYRAMAWVCAFLCTVGGFLFVLGCVAAPPGIPFARPPSPPSAGDAQVISWLRTRAMPGEMVYRTERLDAPIGTNYARYGGLPVPWIDAMVPRFGFRTERLAYRVWLVRTKPADPAFYRHQGIRWLVLAPEEQRLLRLARAWAKSGAAEMAHQIGDLRIFRLDGPLGGSLAANLVGDVQDEGIRKWLELQ